MNKTEYLNRVREEIKNIKKYAPEEYIDNLKFDTFDPGSASNCIYGQMTGDCFSEEAHELIKKCVRYKESFENLDYENHVEEQVLIGYYTQRNFTFLEHYIDNYPADNKHILGYLRGEKQKLILRMKKYVE